MADAVEIELISYEDIVNAWPAYNGLRTLNNLNRKGRKPSIYHIDITVDTSTENTLTESTAPTNTVLNFTTSVQVYLVSDDAGDTDKTVYVIGQKSDGSFGTFTYTTDSSDGTTYVDLGTWNFIAYCWTTNTLAGSVILTDDESSTTTYFTFTSGSGKQGDGIVVVPEGYYGTIITGYAALTAIPGAAANANLVEIGNAWDDILYTSNAVTETPDFMYVESEQTRITLKHAFKTAVTTMNVHLLIAVWEDQSIKI